MLKVAAAAVAVLLDFLIFQLLLARHITELVVEEVPLAASLVGMENILS